MHTHKPCLILHFILFLIYGFFGIVGEIVWTKKYHQSWKFREVSIEIKTNDIFFQWKNGLMNINKWLEAISFSGQETSGTFWSKMLLLRLVCFRFLESVVNNLVLKVLTDIVTHEMSNRKHVVVLLLRSFAYLHSYQTGHTVRSPHYSSTSVS